MDIGRQERAEVLGGGAKCKMSGGLSGGFYMQPTVFKGHNRIRVFQKKIFGPVVSVTTFKDDAYALALANGHALRPWCGRMKPVGQYLLPIWPCHSGGTGLNQLLPRLTGTCGLWRLQAVGAWRENHLKMISHYQQTRNMLVSYSPKKLGFF